MKRHQNKKETVFVVCEWKNSHQDHETCGWRYQSVIELQAWYLNEIKKIFFSFSESNFFTSLKNLR